MLIQTENMIVYTLMVRVAAARGFFLCRFVANVAPGFWSALAERVTAGGVAIRARRQQWWTSALATRVGGAAHPPDAISSDRIAK